MWAGCHLCQRNRWIDDLFSAVLDLCSSEWQWRWEHSCFLSCLYSVNLHLYHGIALMTNHSIILLFVWFLFKKVLWIAPFLFSHPVSSTFTTAEFVLVLSNEHLVAWILNSGQMSYINVLSKQVSPTAFEHRFWFFNKFHFCAHHSLVAW